MVIIRVCYNCGIDFSANRLFEVIIRLYETLNYVTQNAKRKSSQNSIDYIVDVTSRGANNLILSHFRLQFNATNTCFVSTILHPCLS